eukprot:TRINITY_DN8045_c0_g1_i1.p3 TRINITY_DN8045_c0_g1~~TRINITY_DN8045_c0_g1_i1.p3  ORF type:complete len:59 (-),score=2.43 TRINITY_DN8045_c0_g1_i1:544-720(-)
MAFLGHRKCIDDVICQFCGLYASKIVENIDILAGKICNTSKKIFHLFYICECILTEMD